MGFCTECGRRLPYEAKFCPACGEQAQKAQSDDGSRKIEYVGKVVKCPACGTELPSLIGICPGCGHEINAKRISGSLRTFSNEISVCDKIIAANPIPVKSGWSSWGGFKQFCWVVLNAATFGIPLVIYLVLPLLGIWGAATFSGAEKRKASAIKNFALLNERESVLEILLFIKSQMSFIASEKIDRNSVHWASIWGHKAEQIFQKAEILFKGDVISNNAYNDILAKWKKIKMAFGLRVVAAIAMIALFVVFIATRDGFLDIWNVSSVNGSTTEVITTSRQSTRMDKSFDWPDTILSNILPKPESNTGEVFWNSENNFGVYVYGIASAQFETYANECIGRGFTIDSEKTGRSFSGFNNNGYMLNLSFDENDTELRIALEAPMKMTEIQWPQSDIAKSIPVPKSETGNIYSESSTLFIIYVENTSIDDYTEYVDACMDVGFTVDYYRGDGYFRAENSRGYKLSVTYKGFNIMTVSIDNMFPEK